MYNQQTTTTSSYTVAQNVKAVTVANQTTAVTITLPDATKYKDRIIWISRYSVGDTANITVTATAGNVENPLSNALVSSVVLNQDYKQFAYISDAIDWHLVGFSYSNLIVVNRPTASYTLVLGDAFRIVDMNVASGNILTIPLNATVAFPVGTQIIVSQFGAGQTTITPTGGVTIRSSGNKLKLTGQYSMATLIKIGLDEWYLSGDITT